MGLLDGGKGWSELTGVSMEPKHITAPYKREQGHVQDANEFLKKFGRKSYKKEQKAISVNNRAASEQVARYNKKYAADAHKKAGQGEKARQAMVKGPIKAAEQDAKNRSAAPGRLNPGIFAVTGRSGGNARGSSAGSRRFNARIGNFTGR
jgi:hypothetical protein